MPKLGSDWIGGTYPPIYYYHTGAMGEVFKSDECTNAACFSFVILWWVHSWGLRFLRLARGIPTAPAIAFQNVLDQKVLGRRPGGQA